MVASKEVEIRGSWVGLYLGADLGVDFEKKLCDEGCMKSAWNQASLGGSPGRGAIGAREVQQSLCDPADGAKGWIQGLEGQGNGELWFHGYRVSVIQGEEVWEICYNNVHIMLLSYRHKNG